MFVGTWVACFRRQGFAAHWQHDSAVTSSALGGSAGTFKLGCIGSSARVQLCVQCGLFLCALLLIGVISHCALSAAAVAVVNLSGACGKGKYVAFWSSLLFFFY